MPWIAIYCSLLFIMEESMIPTRFVKKLVNYVRKLKHTKRIRIRSISE